MLVVGRYFTNGVTKNTLLLHFLVLIAHSFPPDLLLSFKWPRAESRRRKETDWLWGETESEF
jgi:hypothetical protein